MEMDRMARAWGTCDVTGVVEGEGQRGVGGRGGARGQQIRDGLIGVTWIYADRRHDRCQVKQRIATCLMEAARASAHHPVP